MTQVVALEKGYFRKIRNPGDRFHVHFSDAVIAKSRWLAPVDTTEKPKPDRRVIPNGNHNLMADVLKGVPVEDYDEDDEPIDTMSAMTAARAVEQAVHARAHGLPPSENKPVARKRMGRPKGSKNKPKVEPSEVTP